MLIKFWNLYKKFGKGSVSTMNTILDIFKVPSSEPLEL